MIYDESHWKKKGKREACFKICCKKIIGQNNQNEKIYLPCKEFLTPTLSASGVPVLYLRVWPKIKTTDIWLALTEKANDSKYKPEDLCINYPYVSKEREE